MSQRLTRKEIRKDDFASAVGRSVEYAESHVRTFVYALVAIVVVGAIAAGVYTLLGRRSENANDALAKAMKIYGAPINATGAKPNDAKDPSFADEASRRARAKTLLEKVRSDYSHTDAADVAGLYLAQIAIAEGKPAEARKLWSDFVDKHSDNILAGEARINLIHLDRATGPKVKVEELAQRLKAMTEESEPPLPQDVLLNELGATYDQLGRKDEAIQSYRRIVEEFPQSAYRSSAQQRLSALEPNRPVGVSPGAFALQPGS
jgi:tetratricopeptide (TPR) repeat protein